MIIDCISDLHGELPDLPGGDLLIVAGDITACDIMSQWMQFGFWLNRQPYKWRVWIAGNHDGLIASNRFMAQEIAPGGYYLEDSMIELDGLKIWGSPWTPTFCNWHFMKKRGEEIKAKWDLIPDDTDILITHGPPYGILDIAGFDSSRGKRSVGCADLRLAVERIKPRLHLFGHIHNGYGEMVLKHHDAVKTQTLCVNASLLNEDYDAVNKPIRIVL